MTDPFVAALDAIYASSIAIDAIFASVAGGTALAIRTIRSQPDVISGFGGGQIVQPTNLFEVRRSEVSAPLPGDTFAVTAELFVIVGDPTLDVEGLSWTCGVRLA